jgi:hypothetical protein
MFNVLIKPILKRAELIKKVKGVYIKAMHFIPEMTGEESYLFAIVYRPGVEIQCCRGARGFLFDVLRI